MPSQRTIVLQLHGADPGRPVLVYRRGEGADGPPPDLELGDAILVELGEDAVSLVDAGTGAEQQLDRHEWRESGPWRLRLGGATREPAGTILGAESWAAPEIRIHDTEGRPPLRHALAQRDGYEIVLGRSSAADLLVDDAAVSRRHCRVFARLGCHFVEDLGSRHGTWVAGERIDAPVRLTNGDRIRLGQVSIDYVSYSDAVKGVASVELPPPPRPPREPRRVRLARWWRAARASMRRAVGACRALVPRPRFAIRLRPELMLATLFILLVAAALVHFGRGVLHGS